MPKYRITDPQTGKVVVLTGDSPPTDAELQQIFAELHPAPTAQAPQAPPAAPEQGWRERVLAAADWLPTALSTGASLATGPFKAAIGMPVAGAAGAIGELLRSTIEMATDPIPEGAGPEAVKRMVGKASVVPGRMAIEGAKQAGLEGGGRVISGGARMLGRGLVDNAVRPSPTLQAEFPEVIDTIVKERIPVGKGLFDRTKGSQLAAQKLGNAGKALRALLAKAEQSGTRFSAEEVAQPVLSLVDDIAKQPLGKAEEERLSQMLWEFMDRHKGPLTPQAVKELKSRAQAIAKPIYRAQERGNVVTADQALGARFNSAIATGSKKTLETVEGVGKAEAKTQELIGATKAIKQAERKRLSGPAEVLVGSAGVGTLVAGLMNSSDSLPKDLRDSIGVYLVTRGIASPRVLSRGGLLLTNRQAQDLMQNFPRLATFVTSQTGAGTASTEQR